MCLTRDATLERSRLMQHNPCSVWSSDLSVDYSCPKRIWQYFISIIIFCIFNYCCSFRASQACDWHKFECSTVWEWLSSLRCTAFGSYNSFKMYASCMWIAWQSLSNCTVSPFNDTVYQLLSNCIKFFFGCSLPSSLSLFLLPLKSSCWAVLVKLYVSLPAALLCNRTQTVSPLMTVYYMHSFSPSPHSLSLGRTFSHSCHTQTVSAAIKPILRHFLD